MAGAASRLVCECCQGYSNSEEPPYPLQYTVKSGALVWLHPQCRYAYEKLQLKVLRVSGVVPNDDEILSPSVN